MPQSYSKSFIKDNATVIAGHILVYMKGIILMPIIIKTVGVTIYGGFVLLSSLLWIVFEISSFGARFRMWEVLSVSRKHIGKARILLTRTYFFRP